MFRVVTRFLAVLTMSVTLIGIGGASALAAPGGNEAISTLCADGGYAMYMDADGKPFKNEGQCTRYGARGLTPVLIDPVDDDDGPIHVEWFTSTAVQISDGDFGPRFEVTVTGYQLEAGATVFLTLAFTNGFVGDPQPFGTVDDYGSYSHSDPWACDDVASLTFQTTDHFGSTVQTVAASPCLPSGD